MSKNLDNLRGRIIYILSNFPRISVEILSHYFGQQSTANVEKEIQDLVQDGIVSSSEKHPMDGQKALLQLTTFGEDHLRSIQENLEFQSPKATKKEHIEVLRSRETVFMLDVKIMAFLLLLETEKRLLHFSSAQEKPEQPTPTPTGAMAGDGVAKEMWIQDTRLQELFVPMTSKDASIQFIRNVLSAQEEKTEKTEKRDDGGNVGRISADGNGDEESGRETVFDDNNNGTESDGEEKDSLEGRKREEEEGTASIESYDRQRLRDEKRKRDRRSFMEGLFTAKIPPELERRRNLAYIRNLLFALCSKKLIRFRGSDQFALNQSTPKASHQ